MATIERRKTFTHSEIMYRSIRILNTHYRSAFETVTTAKATDAEKI
jgi:hypothetical protein